MELTWHKFYKANKNGMDWFVGDIHGNLDLLMESLSKVGFNEKIDRLFCAGDLINRGPDSKGVVALLKNKWFHSVIGNHELMLIEAAKDRSLVAQIAQFGGEWIADLTPAKLSSMANMFLSKLSLSATIPVADKIIGVVHSSSPENWQYLQMDPPNDDIRSTLIDYCLWDFGQGSGAGSCCHVRNVDAIVSGHISTDKRIVRHNHIWIDTVAKTGSLTVLNARQILDLVNK